MTTKSLNCPNCGAPLSVTTKQTVAICLYCSASVRIAAWPEAAASETGTLTSPTSVIEEIPQEVSERVKQMVVEGARAEAIQFYAEQAGVSPAEAETAVNQLAIHLVPKLIAQMSMRIGWLLVHSLIVAGQALALVWSTLWVLRGGYIWLVALPVLLGFTLYKHLRWLIPRGISSWVYHYGSEAHARILKSSAIYPMHKGAMLVRLLMEVQPLSGKPSFRDEESLLIHEDSLYKVQPGNVIRVRYARGRTDRVFSTNPIEVLETGK